MWPWGHLAFGYVLYSMYTHLWKQRAPSSGLALILALSTQIPDVVDKPLSWAFKIFPSGYSIAHSIIIAVPLMIGVIGITQYVNRSEVGVAFGIGYGSHLLGDLLVAVLTSGATVGRVLWPLVTQPAYSHDLGLFQRFRHYLNEYLLTLLQGENIGMFLVQLTFVFLTVGLWVYDGAPGLVGIRSISSRIR